MFDGIGPGQVAIVAVIVLLLFGGSRIPETMRGLGAGIREFKKGMRGEEDMPAGEIGEDQKRRG